MNSGKLGSHEAIAIGSQHTCWFRSSAYSMCRPAANLAVHLSAAKHHSASICKLSQAAKIRVESLQCSGDVQEDRERGSACSLRTRACMGRRPPAATEPESRRPAEAKACIRARCLRARCFSPLRSLPAVHSMRMRFSKVWQYSIASSMAA